MPKGIKTRQDYFKAKELLDRAKKKAAQEGNLDLVKKADVYDKQLEKQIAQGSEGLTSSLQRGRGYTEKIDNKPLKVLGGTDWAKKIVKSRAAKSALKGGLKSIPFLGGIAAALGSGDVSAAIPVLNEAEALGPEAGSPEAAIEDPSVSTEDRMKILQRLKDQYK